MTGRKPESRNRWVLLVTLATGVLILILALLPLDPITPDLAHRFAALSSHHPLGTDELGRDLAARLAAGARLSVGFTAVAGALCFALGTATGLLAGLRAGPAAQLLQNIVDILVAVPTVLFGLVLAAVLGPGISVLVFAVLVTGWTPFARLAYQLGVRERTAGYVEASLALGARHGRILARHLLPNTVRPLIAHACLRFANTMLTVAGLSFLGLGAQPPTPEWGAMLADGLNYLYLAPRLVLAPMTTIITVTVLVTILGRTLDHR